MSELHDKDFAAAGAYDFRYSKSKGLKAQPLYCGKCWHVCNEKGSRRSIHHFPIAEVILAVEQWGLLACILTILIALRRTLAFTEDKN